MFSVLEYQSKCASCFLSICYGSSKKVEVMLRFKSLPLHYAYKSCQGNRISMIDFSIFSAPQPTSSRTLLVSPCRPSPPVAKIVPSPVQASLRLPCSPSLRTGTPSTLRTRRRHPMSGPTTARSRMTRSPTRIQTPLARGMKRMRVLGLSALEVQVQRVLARMTMTRIRAADQAVVVSR